MKFPLKTFIVEDVGTELNVLLKRLKPEFFEVFAEATFKGAVNTLQNHQHGFNTSILDVQLGDQKTCWELIETFGRKKFGVMAFTSAYSDLKMEYIPKHHRPLVLTKPHNTKNVDNLINELLGVVREINNGIPYEYCFMTINRKYLTLNANQILYFKGKKDHSWIYYRSDETKELKEDIILHSLSSIVRNSDKRIFWNLHRSYIFNKNYLDDLTEGKLLTGKFSLEVKVVIFVRSKLKRLLPKRKK